MSTSTAATARGQILTTKVATSLQAKNQIRVSFTAGEQDAVDFMVKPAGYRTSTQMTSNRGKVTFSGKYWDSFEQFCNYFNTHATQIGLIRMETDDVDNYDHELILRRKAPTGKELEFSLSLSPYKTESSKSTGYSNTLVIPASDLNFVLSAFTEMELSKIKAGSTIHFYIDILGETRSVDLTAIDAEIL